jgi:hypothetical protein
VRDADAIAPLAGLRCLNADTPAHVLRNAALDLPGRRRIADVTLLPASPHPRKVIGVGVNYRCTGTSATNPAYPVVFCKFAFNLIAGEADIELVVRAIMLSHSARFMCTLGKKRAMLARHVRNRRLYHAVDRWAFCGLSTSPGARQFYEQRRRGTSTRGLTGPGDDRRR